MNINLIGSNGSLASAIGRYCNKRGHHLTVFGRSVPQHYTCDAYNRMVLNIVVPVGAVKFVIYDNREGSRTKGQFEEIVLSPADNYQRLTVQPGLWMAFAGAGEGTSMLMDIIPEVHDDSESDRLDISEIAYNFSL